MPYVHRLWILRSIWHVHYDSIIFSKLAKETKPSTSVPVLVTDSPPPHTKNIMGTWLLNKIIIPSMDFFFSQGHQKKIMGILREDVKHWVGSKRERLLSGTWALAPSSFPFINGRKLTGRGFSFPHCQAQYSLTSVMLFKASLPRFTPLLSSFPTKSSLASNFRIEY